MKKLMLAGLIVLSAVSFARGGGHKPGGGDCPEGIQFCGEDKATVVLSGYLSVPIKAEFDGDIDFGCLPVDYRGNLDKTAGQNSAKLIIQGSKDSVVLISYEKGFKGVDKIQEYGMGRDAKVETMIKAEMNGSKGPRHPGSGSGNEEIEVTLSQSGKKGIGKQEVEFKGYVTAENVNKNLAFSREHEVTVTYAMSTK